MIEVNTVREQIAEAGLTYNQIYGLMGYSRSWFYKAFETNPLYKLNKPSQQRLRDIQSYVLAYNQFRLDFVRVFEKVKQKRD
jgi:hypothetical protein